ncbi:MAG: OmpA family protein, partial [Bacteroidota bacterium]
VDKRSNKPLRARFELIDVARNEVVVQSWSSKFDGEFLVSLPTNREYALNVSKEGYQFHSEHFRMTGPATAAEPFRKNIALQQLEEGVTVALRNIFFDTDKFDLKPTSVAELQKLQQFLTDNPTVSIEVRGHTDDVGDAASNQQLSENRAKAVYEYLVENGIEAARLAYKGYGESEPEVPNDSDANRAQNRRTEIKILKL